MANDKPQKVEINPDSALTYIDEALSMYEGTRNSHKVLEASMGLLRAVVAEWKQYTTDAKETVTAKNPKPKGAKPTPNRKTKTRGKSKTKTDSENVVPMRGRKEA